MKLCPLQSETIQAQIKYCKYLCCKLLFTF